MMEPSVGEPNIFWRSCGIPVFVTVGVFAGMNGFWTNPDRPLFPVFLVSSLVALGVMWSAVRTGRVSQHDLGLAITGWTAPKRLLGLTMILLFGYAAFTSIEPVPRQEPIATETEKVDSQTDAQSALTVTVEPEEPSWGDFCFWYLFALPASFTELLVFISVGFCLVEAYLRQRGVRPLAAIALAAILVAVSFGLFHFTYPRPWWAYVIFPLMPAMLINICLFVMTRNFYLTLLLHNAFAAIGFLGEQYAEFPPNPKMQPAHFQQPIVLAPLLLSFLVSFLLLHWLESKKLRVDG